MNGTSKTGTKGPRWIAWCEGAAAIGCLMGIGMTLHAPDGPGVRVVFLSFMVGLALQVVRTPM